MQGFVVPDFHAEQSPNRTTNNGKPDKRRFGNAPFIFFRPEFIDTIGKESDDIYQQKIYQYQFCDRHIR